MKKMTRSIALAAVLLSAGCANWNAGTGTGIMRTEPGDPAGSANIGTGSVTTGATIPQEAKSAGIGLGP
jgi:hypothetical protein